MNHGEDKIMMLHDDLLLNCLARVSRAYYPTLSLVSKRFHSLVTSTELYKTRTRLGHTENCLYVGLRLRTGSELVYWFILCERQNSSKRVLVPIPSPSSTSAACMSGIAVVGPNIYAIGGGKYTKTLSSSVMVMDSRFHTWREAPSMRVARKFPSVCTLDEKIYVSGGCDNLDSTNWMEVFDAKTQTWELLQIPSKEICGGSDYTSIIYEGTVYVRSISKNVTYKLEEGRWIEADMSINYGWGWSSSYCVIDNVFYSYTINKICWYDPREGVWTTLKGLERLPTLPCLGPAKLADHGGKMSIIWEEYDQKNVLGWCAEVMLERRQNLEIWGTLEWFNIVYTSDGPISIDGLVHALTTTVW